MHAHQTLNHVNISFPESRRKWGLANALYNVKEATE